MTEGSNSVQGRMLKLNYYINFVGEPDCSFKFTTKNQHPFAGFQLGDTVGAKLGDGMGTSSTLEGDVALTAN